MVRVCAIGAPDRQAGSFFSRSAALKAFHPHSPRQGVEKGSIAMGGSGADANSLSDRKQAERRRLAEALRANLSRRKAKSRDRRTVDAAAGDSARDEAGADDAESAGAGGDVPRTDPASEGSAQEVETGD
jgi:hypothetical protein